MEFVYKVKTRTILINSLTDKIKIWFFGDIHKFTKSCDEDRWKWFLKKAKENHDKHTYYMGMGDYMDFASSSEQTALIKNPALHDQTIIDLGDLVKKRNKSLAKEMSFMKPNILGMIDGNHNWKFTDGTTGTQDLADRLGTEYLGWLCHLTLRIRIETEKAHRQKNIYIAACHGKAGGKSRGNSLNQLDDLFKIMPMSDIFAMGHDHQRFAVPQSVLIPSTSPNGDTTLKQKRQFFLRSGSFKKAYTPNDSAYEVGKLYRPSDIGATYLEIGFHRDYSDGDRIITDITGTI